MKNVMATGNRTTLQVHHLSKSCTVGIEDLEIDINDSQKAVGKALLMLITIQS